MQSLARRIGFWSSSAAALMFLVFTGCFIAILVANPLFMWTDLADYVTYREAHTAMFASVAQAAMLAFGVLYVLILHCLLEVSAAQQQFFVRSAISFAVCFATLTSMHYFVQISAVRMNIEQGTVQGLEQFLQAKPDSALAAINMLGWTVFFGGSSLLVAPALGGNRLGTAIRWLFWVNGVCCLLAGIGYILNWVVLVFLTMNLGMGSAVTALTILLAVYFRRQDAMASQPGKSAELRLA